MDLEFDIDLIAHAVEKEEERAAWDLWALSYKDMTDETFIPFEEFRDNLYVRKKPMKSKQDIEAEFEAIIENDNKVRGGE